MTPRLLILALIAAWASPVLAGPAQVGPGQVGHAPIGAVQARFDDLIGQSRSAMLAVPAQALVFAQQAAAAAGSIADDRARQLAQSQAHWLEAEALNRTGKADQAAKVAAAALAIVGKLDPGAKLEGDLIATTGQIARAKGDVGTALAQYQHAFQIYERKNERRSQAKVLQYIGTIYFDAGDYARMLKYYADSAELFDDPSIRMAALNNQGDALIELKRYKEAFDHYQQALGVARSMDSDELVTSIITNMAAAQVRAGNLAAANRLVGQGLASKGARDPQLAAFLWGIRAQIEWASKAVPAAKADLDKVFGGLDLAKTTHEFLEFHLLASEVYAASGDFPRALAHAHAYQRLDQERRAVMTSTNSALMAAQFDYANQELKLSRIRAKKLESDVALEKSRERYNQLTFYGLIALLLIAGLVVSGLVKALRAIRRSRNEVRLANLTLQDTNAELARALEAKTRFLATTSHEIRTPLNGILGMAEVLLSDSSVTGPVRDRVKTVHDAGTTMKALVDDILDVAKMETSGVAVECEPTRLKPLLSGVVDLWGSQATLRGIAVKTELTGCSELVLCDPRLVRQITFNLLSNAVKFTEQGQVDLVAETRNGMLKIAVRDTGIGIAAEHLDDIFKSFHQVDNSTQRQFGGTGLGLAISRTLARAMGGDVQVVSKVGEGSTFTLSIPLNEADAGTRPEQGQPIETPVALPATGILLIESSPLGRNVMAKAIAADGVEVIQADGRETASTAAGDAIGLIVVDIASAGGWDGLTAILAAPAWSGRSVPVLALVQGEIDDAVKAQAATLGITRILSRPMSAATLRAGVTSMLPVPTCATIEPEKAAA